EGLLNILDWEELDLKVTKTIEQWERCN
ncbi:hypothetical protein SFB2_055G1, partial [Candidatus Arthromitus sp. SFB-2]